MEAGRANHVWRVEEIVGLLFMHIISVVEMVVGGVILAGYTNSAGTLDGPAPLVTTNNGTADL